MDLKQVHKPNCFFFFPFAHMNKPMRLLHYITTLKWQFTKVVVVDSSKESHPFFLKLGYFFHPSAQAYSTESMCVCACVCIFSTINKPCLYVQTRFDSKLSLAEIK
jgi:hypothetical protein